MSIYCVIMFILCHFMSFYAILMLIYASFDVFFGFLMFISAFYASNCALKHLFMLINATLMSF